ncbi:vesicle transport protein GOT1B [Puma concolor]|uniref:Vesicle transport protein GOT1B n=1 Tax=Puma concolor TaxID=9696 RepID=A0A6P6IEQ7_PUMCO|nr:vesicle transport protein GOT1B [Puma concolor]
MFLDKERDEEHGTHSKYFTGSQPVIDTGITVTTEVIRDRPASPSGRKKKDGHKRKFDARYPRFILGDVSAHDKLGVLYKLLAGCLGGEIGMGLTGFGVFFLFFGMILFFDKALLAIGNVLFVAGLAFVIGLERTFRFFFQKHKMKATGFFLGGVFVVLIGWPLIGMIFEIYGFFLLFRGFFPVVIGFIRRVPVLGSLLNLPGIRSFVDKVGESNNMV